jgi:hypothetical protein
MTSVAASTNLVNCSVLNDPTNDFQSISGVIVMVADPIAMIPPLQERDLSTMPVPVGYEGSFLPNRSAQR